MIVKMLLTLDFDPATGEYKSLKQEIVKEEPTKKVAVEVEDTAEPQVTLDSNKYILNKAAAAMIGAAWGDRISINYQKIEGVTFPIIGTDEALVPKVVISLLKVCL